MKILESACVDAMMMEFSKFFDDSEQTKSIFNLLQKCETNICLFENKEDVLKQIRAFEDKYGKDEFISKGIKTLKMRRDKYFAHNDRQFFVNQDKDKSYLPMYNLWFMRDYIRDIIYYLYAELGKDVKELEKPQYAGGLKNLYKHSEE